MNTRCLIETTKNEVDKSFRLTLMIIGGMTLACALLHGSWHVYFAGYEQLQGMSPLQLQTLQLLNAAITVFVLLMSAACFLVARDQTLSLAHLKRFTGLVALFWTLRFLLELAMPLQIPFLWIEPSSAILIFPLLHLIVLSFPFLRSKDAEGKTRAAPNS